MKRSAVAVLLLLASLLGAAASGTRFSDVPDTAPLAPAATWAADNGIMRGFADGTFRPNGVTIRKHAVSWLWRQAGSPTPLGPDPYPDVPDDAWYAPAAAWANEAGLVTGFADGTFGPDEQTSRQQLVSWLWRRAGTPAPAAPVRFDDVPPTAWYARAAAWSDETGLVTGYADNTFRPEWVTLRRQVASWLWREAGGPLTERPNLVLVLTDDQTLESLRVMDQTEALIGDQGTTFTQAVANYPLCCPARATLLTGQYAHNHGVQDNTPPHGGYAAFDPTSTLPVWLSDAGYETAHVGKYLNFYASTPESSVVPPGWTHWFAPIEAFPRGMGYYDYDVIDDGAVEYYGEQDEDYLTDVMADRALADMDSMAASGRPFYLHVSTLAPHTGRDRGDSDNVLPAAPRHEGTMAAEPPPATPAIGEEDLSDKPQWIRELVEPTWPDLAWLVPIGYQRYLQTLLAVDDLVGDLVDRLDSLGELDNTVFVFTSDNGWTFGEHQIAFAKVLPYEEIARVPLLIRGPGFPAGTVRDQPVGHIDVVPTFLAAAGVTAPAPRDGESLQPFAADGAFRSDRVMLIADGPPFGYRQHYEGVRTAAEWYTEHGVDGDGGIEYYDLRTDPFQLESRHDDPLTLSARNRLSAVLDQLVGCVGAACRVTDP